MACYHPLIRIVDSIFNPHATYIQKKDGTLRLANYIMSKEEFKIRYKNKKIDGELIQEIPCGKCIGCRLDYSRMWANRITLEAKEWPQETCWFITLTYNDENIPLKEVENTKTGEKKIGQTLSKEDLQKFNKRLRRHYSYHYEHENIRFFAAGEYGETGGRPHYHICYFNLPIYTELIEVKKNELGQTIWTNKEIEKIWGKGFISIARQSWETAAYTARYILKKQKGEDAKWYYTSQAKIPEFTLMSRNPGIAKEYYEKYKNKIYEYDKITYQKGKKIKEAKPPRYFDKLYDIEEHDMMEEIKLNRRTNAIKKHEVEMQYTTLTEEELLNIKEKTQKEKIKKCKRTL